MSVDWTKYTTSLETRNRGRIPSDNAVISMVAGAVRAIEALVVEHAPIQDSSIEEGGNQLKPNRAHSEVIGEKTTEVRVKLSRTWRWQLRLGEQ
jgi:hypothetical protein